MGVAHGALDAARLPFRHLDLFLLRPDARLGREQLELVRERL